MIRYYVKKGAVALYISERKRESRGGGGSFANQEKQFDERPVDASLSHRVIARPSRLNDLSFTSFRSPSLALLSGHLHRTSRCSIPIKEFFERRPGAYAAVAAVIGGGQPRRRRLRRRRRKLRWRWRRLSSSSSSQRRLLRLHGLEALFEPPFSRLRSVGRMSRGGVRSWTNCCFLLL